METARDRETIVAPSMSGGARTGEDPNGGSASPRNRRRFPGFTLLELQVAAVIGVLVFSGLALTASLSVQHIEWLEGTGQKLMASAGAMGPFGVEAITSQVIVPGANLTGLYWVDLQSVTFTVPTIPITISATVVRRTASTTDCGR
jgi:hypothetical protein